MDPLAIPVDARCRVGMVAMLGRLRAESNGKLVVVREPAGYLSTMVGCNKPAFSWYVHSLGAPLQCKDRPSRDAYVADICLTPVGEMTEAQIKKLIKSDALADFNEAKDDLYKILAKSNMTAEQLHQQVEMAGHQFAIQHALEVVPTGTVLREIGFRLCQPDGEVLEWAGVHKGNELRFSAGRDFAAAWLVVATGHTARTATWDERLLLEEAPRGHVLQVVLSMWRSAFKSISQPVPTPDCLALGLVYEKHCKVMSRIGTGLPSLRLDPQVFRATRKLILARYHRPGENATVWLSHADGLLRLAVGSTVFGVPARGIWVEDREISMDDFAAIPAQVMRHRSFELEQSAEHLSINKVAIVGATCTDAGF